MSFWQQVRRVTHKLYVGGLRLKCPNCEEGRMFKHLFEIEPTCDVCHVRFERLDGESIGGMAITMGIIPPMSLLGYFIVAIFFDVPVWINASFWLLFIIIGVTWIYRHSRAAWVVISYLTGGVYADENPPEPPVDSTEAREALVKLSQSIQIRKDGNE